MLNLVSLQSGTALKATLWHDFLFFPLTSPFSSSKKCQQSPDEDGESQKKKKEKYENKSHQWLTYLPCTFPRRHDDSDTD
jgi:hypothetical protein